MPRGYKKSYKKSYKKRSNKKYSNKLADKKINTLVEKRIVEISRKEDARNQVWYTPTKTITDASFNWDLHGPYLRVPTASFLSINAGTIFHQRLTDFQDMIESDILSNNPAKKIVLRVSGFRTFFQFRNDGVAPIRLKVWLVDIPTSATLIPTAETMPGGHLNGLYFPHPGLPRQNLPYKYRILAHKTIVVKPGVLYLPPMLISSVSTQSGIVEPTYGTYTNSNPVWTEQTSTCILNYKYPGKGKKFIYDSSQTGANLNALQSNVYVCIIADGVLQLLGNVVSRFRLESNIDKAQPVMV